MSYLHLTDSANLNLWDFLFSWQVRKYLSEDNFYYRVAAEDQDPWHQ